MVSTNAGADWNQKLSKTLSIFGHRNWIVVADSAYPHQSQVGIETTLSNMGHVETLRIVLDAIHACRHVKPRIYLDSELPSVLDSDSPGIDRLRAEIGETLGGYGRAENLPHDQTIAKLDRAAQMFSVLVIKTTATMPYTSVFLELECQYWTEAAEARLRQSLRTSERLGKP